MMIVDYWYEEYIYFLGSINCLLSYSYNFIAIWLESLDSNVLTRPFCSLIKCIKSWSNPFYHLSLVPVMIHWSIILFGRGCSANWVLWSVMKEIENRMRRESDRATKTEELWKCTFFTRLYLPPWIVEL